MTASIAGILYIGDQAAAVPANLGQGYELNAIAAAVVGGCSLAGRGRHDLGNRARRAVPCKSSSDGVGTVIKQESDMYQGLVVGLVLICTSAFSQFRESSGPGKRLFPGPLGATAILALAAIGRHAHVAGGQQRRGDLHRGCHVGRSGVRQDLGRKGGGQEPGTRENS